jgi:hypothetical protein
VREVLFQFSWPLHSVGISDIPVATQSLLRLQALCLEAALHWSSCPQPQFWPQGYTHEIQRKSLCPVEILSSLTSLPHIWEPMGPFHIGVWIVLGATPGHFKKKKAYLLLTSCGSFFSWLLYHGGNHCAFTFFQVLDVLSHFMSQTPST